MLMNLNECPHTVSDAVTDLGYEHDFLWQVVMDLLV